MQHQKMKRLQRHIPEEIIILILQRLPVKSLLRFRCVQKSWYHLIQNPSFVIPHATCQKKYLLVGSIRYDPVDYSTCINSSSLSLRFDEVQCKEYYRITWEEYSKIYQENLRWKPRWYAAASQGLICYSNVELEAEGRMFLWNPAIKKVKILPDHPWHRYCALWITVAFGFCKKANDFKLVKILKSCDDRYENQTIVVQVYSLNTNSWRSVNDSICNLICTNMLSTDDWVFLNSTAYFMGSKGYDSEPIIVSYDTDKDVAREISLPEPKIRHFLRRSIRVLDDSLVIFMGKRDDDSFNMWVLKQSSDPNKFCWEKKININLGGINSNWEVLALRSNGEIVLRESSENGLVSYDAEKDEEKDFADSWDQWFEPDRRLFLRIDSFSESLVLINT